MPWPWSLDLSRKSRLSQKERHRHFFHFTRRLKVQLGIYKYKGKMIWLIRIRTLNLMKILYWNSGRWGSKQATTKRAFSAMKLLKTRLRNKMEDKFLRDCMLIYIEREIAIKFTTDSIIDDLYAKKNRKVRLKWNRLFSLTHLFVKCS